VKRPIVSLSVIALLVAGALSGTTIGKVLPGVSTGTASAAEYDVQPQKPEAPLAPVGGGFTYQGKLVNGGAPANGQYDFTFTLFDSAAGGQQVGSPVSVTNQAVNNGTFTSMLNFPPTAFRGEARWLQIAVRPASSGNYVTLSPRQALTAVPYALSAPWEGVYNRPAGFNPARPQHSRLALDDTSMDVGEYPSIAIGADGLPLISYWDKASGDLKVIHCETLDCTQFSSFVVDNTANVGKYSSLAIGSDGLGLIAYQNLDNGRVKVAHCMNVECSSSVLYMASILQSGEWISLNIGPDGLGQISFYDPVNKDLMLAQCFNVQCSGASVQTVFASADPLISYGKYSALTFLADGKGYIAHRGDIPQAQSSSFYLSRCNNAQCTNATHYGLGQAASDVAMAVGPDGQLWVSFVENGGLYVRNFNDGSGARNELPIETNVKYTSIAVLPSGLPVVSFYDEDTDDLKLVLFQKAVMTEGPPLWLEVEYRVVNLETFNNTGLFSSLAIGADGNPIIAYHEETSGDLKVIHCSNPSCIPYNRGR